MCRKLMIHFNIPAEQFPLTLASDDSETTFGKTVRNKVRIPGDKQKKCWSVFELNPLRPVVGVFYGQKPRMANKAGLEWTLIVWP